MKYTSEIIIELPLEAFIKKFDSTENLRHWQRGLISAEHISGTPGELGAKMKLNFKFGKQNMELIETITNSNFPHEFHANFNTKGVHNTQQNFFNQTEDGYTHWISKSDFMPLNFMMKTMLFLMPGIFKKQSLKYMQDFKNFAENGVSVAYA